MPGKNVAIIGCGQLAKMMAEAGQTLGAEFSFLAEPDENTSCIDGLGKVVVREERFSAEALFHALGSPDVITLEREQVDLNFLHGLETYCPIHPNLAAMSAAQNRIKERETLVRLGIPVAKFQVAANKADMLEKAQSLQFPIFIKHPTLGYDGNNQWVVRSEKDLRTLDLPQTVYPLLLEQAVPFDYEASLIAARSPKGEVVFYAPTMNTHVEGILVKSNVPDDIDFAEHLKPAYTYMLSLLRDWNYVGVLTIELFATKHDILINEVAPRVHNSGHWTMDACESSQFENHIRAVLDLPLGNTVHNESVAMVNLLGVDHVPQNMMGEKDVVHWYNKSVRPRRKMGHVNMLASDSKTLLERQSNLVEQIYADFSALQKTSH